MSKIYKSRFRGLMNRKRLFDQVPSGVWKKDWNVNIQAVGDSGQTIRYLSRYVFQVPIFGYLFEKIENGRVTFRYKKPGSFQDRLMTLDYRNSSAGSCSTFYRRAL